MFSVDVDEESSNCIFCLPIWLFRSFSFSPLSDFMITQYVLFVVSIPRGVRNLSQSFSAFSAPSSVGTTHNFVFSSTDYAMNKKLNNLTFNLLTDDSSFLLRLSQERESFRAASSKRRTYVP